MEIGLLAHDALGEEPEGLNHMALRDLDAAGDARSLEDAPTKVRVGIPIGCAIPEQAVLTANRTYRSRAPSPTVMMDPASALIVKPPSSPISTFAPIVTAPPS